MAGAVIEEFMLDIMYEIPKDDQIGTVTITRDYIEGKGAPVISMREYDRLEEKKEETAEAVKMTAGSENIPVRESAQA